MSGDGKKTKGGKLLDSPEDSNEESNVVKKKEGSLSRRARPSELPAGMMSFQLIPSITNSSTRAVNNTLDSNVELGLINSFNYLFNSNNYVINKPLQSVLENFDDLILSLDFKNSSFFESKEIVDDFLKRFEKFQNVVESKLDTIESFVSVNEISNNFSDDWRDNLRKASYYAFFIHYGQKRKGEKDEKGDPLDYIYHPMNASLSNVVFNCEPTIIACIFHDILEDWEKGVMSILNDESKSHNEMKIAIEKSFHNICKELDEDSGRSLSFVFDNIESLPQQLKDSKDYLGYKPFYFTDTFRFWGEDSSEEKNNNDYVGIESLVKILTKSSKNRARAICDMLSRIFQYNGFNRISASRALTIKCLDRLDNTRSFVSLINKPDGVEKAKRMELETVYFYLALCKSFRMWSMADQFHDYIYFKDPEARKARYNLRKESLTFDEKEGIEKKNKQLRDEFKDDFQYLIRGFMEDESITEGKDYTILFRQIGLRNEDMANVEELTAKGEYAIAFQNYIVFKPINHSFPDKLDESYQGKIDAANLAFQTLFDENLPDIELPNQQFLNNSLGSILGDIRNRNTGNSFYENNYNKKYGVGIWVVAESAEEISEEILGYIDYSWFYQRYNNRNNQRYGGSYGACDILLTKLNQIEKNNRFILSLYNILDSHRNVDIIKNDVRRKVLGKDTQEKFLLSLKEINQYERYLDKLVMTLLMEKKKKVNVRLHYFDENNNKQIYEGDARLPEDVNINSWAPISFLTFEDKEEVVNDFWLGIKGSNRMKPVVHEDDEGNETILLEYEIPQKREFSSVVFKNQTAFIDKLLSKYYSKVMIDEVSSQNATVDLTSTMMMTFNDLRRQAQLEEEVTEKIKVDLRLEDFSEDDN